MNFLPIELIEQITYHLSLTDVNKLFLCNKKLYKKRKYIFYYHLVNYKKIMKLDYKMNFQNVIFTLCDDNIQEFLDISSNITQLIFGSFCTLLLKNINWSKLKSLKYISLNSEITEPIKNIKFPETIIKLKIVNKNIIDIANYLPCKIREIILPINYQNSLMYWQYKNPTIKLKFYNPTYQENFYG